MIDRASDGFVGASAIRKAIAQIDQLLPLSRVELVDKVIEDCARTIMRSLQRLLREVARGATGTERPRIHRDIRCLLQPSAISFSVHRIS